METNIAATFVPHQDTYEMQIFSINGRFFKDFKNGAVLKQANFCKENEFSLLGILKYLFRMIFTGKGLFLALDSEDKLDFCKNIAC